MLLLALRSATIALVLTLTGLATAQVQISTRVSSRVVEVGATLTIEGSGMSEDNAPSQPRLKTPPGVSVRGPSVGTSHSMSFGSGGMVHQRGLTAKWQMVFPKTGTFTVGPISMLTAQGRVEGEPVEIKVVAKGSLPTPPRRRRPSIFDDDFMSNRGRSIFDDLLRDSEPEPPAAPPEYQMDEAPEAPAFLRALGEPKSVVVGEQVTYRVLAYSRQGRFGLGVGHEARYPDFYAHDLPRSGRPDWHDVVVDGQRYKAVEIRAKALFPLKTGNLSIGPMEMEIRGPGLHPAQRGANAVSESLTISVAEPPQQGRPPGYELGDVGDYSLTVSVTPRTIPVGGSIAVTANLEGVGNVPSHLLTPDQKGVEWLQPTLRSNLELRDGDKVGGSRTFVYLVKFDEAGSVDLGALTLPYYSARSRRYKVARAALGTVTVVATPGSEAASGPPQPSRTKLSDLVSVRALGTTPTANRASLSDHPAFWWLAFAPPGLVLLAQLAMTRLQGLARRRRSQHTSPSHLAQAALRQAEGAARAGDGVATAAELERALFLALESATGLKARGILQVELPERLRQAGLEPALADEVVARLQACENARFASAEIPAVDLLTQCRATVKALSRQKVKGHA